jgi:signal transduction histidine kinase/ligand-binding sensor domain-containing protein
LSACLLALSSTGAAALTLAEYEHTSWGLKEGIVSVAWTQDAPNGMLKLATSIGDQVFDGVKFYRFTNGEPPPLADYVGALGQRSPTGPIYFPDPVTRHLMRQWNGLTETVDDKAIFGLRAAQFVFDLDGVGWFQNGQELYRLEGLKVEPIGPAWGITKATFGNVVVDARGTAWVATDEGAHGALYYLPRGARRFERFAEPIACFPGALAPDGSLWCATDRGVAVVTIVDGKPVSLRFVTKLFVSAIAFDSSGGFWAASMSGGLAHLSNWRTLLSPDGDAALAADTMMPKDGLASDGIWSIRGDSAGNVWVATHSGLERFRAATFTPVKLPRIGWGAALEADADGSLWAGNFEGNLMHISNGRIEDVPEIKQVRAMRHDAEGRIWVTGKFGVWRKDAGGVFVHVEGPGSSSIPQFTEIAEDDSGAMWFRHTTRLMRLRDGQWSTPEGPAVPPPSARYFMLSDEQRQLWFIGTGRVYVLKSGLLRTIESPEYAAIGNPLSAYFRGPRVWIGAAMGVGVFIGDEFHPLKLITDEANLSITGILETPEGDLWLHGLGRAYRISRAQVDAGLNGHAVTPEVFDYHDGLLTVTSAFEPRPTLIQDAAGRLWFSTAQGLFWIDPHAQRKVIASAPRTVLGAVTSDGKLIPAGAVVSLPPNPGQTEFSYAAAALGVGDRVHFRYRVDGIDNDWRDVGARRTAYYTQLPPGRHRFEVMASNEQGLWAQSPTTLDFEIRLAWYQTRWFLLAVVMLSVGFLCLIYRMRIRVVASRERARLDEITAERERIARDLHDTLLQSMQGVILGFQGLATKLPPQDEVRQSIEGRLDYADQLLGEARDRVRNLRATGAAGTGLREAFEQIACELADTIRLKVVEEGSPRILRPVARDGIYLVGREALLNAVTHGKGTDIELRLQFTSRRLVLRVSDNGIGIDPAVLAAGSRPEHFGLLGMRERATQLGAAFNLSRATGGGTDVVLDVPASHAYEATEEPVLWRRLRGGVRILSRAVSFGTGRVRSALAGRPKGGG